MKMLLLSDTAFDYLNHVFTSHLRHGLHPDELQVAAVTQTMLSQATEVPQPGVHLGKAQVAELGPNGITLEVPLDSE